MGYAKTFIMLFKGFIGTGILYMPKSFLGGGYFFSGLAMVLSYMLSTICALKLIAARQKCGAKSYSDVGFAAFGTLGKVIVDIPLGVS